MAFRDLHPGNQIGFPVAAFMVFGLAFINLIDHGLNLGAYGAFFWVLAAYVAYCILAMRATDHENQEHPVRPFEQGNQHRPPRTPAKKSSNQQSIRRKDPRPEPHIVTVKAEANKRGKGIITGDLNRFICCPHCQSFSRHRVKNTQTFQCNSCNKEFSVGMH